MSSSRPDGRYPSDTDGQSDRWGRGVLDPGPHPAGDSVSAWNRCPQCHVVGWAVDASPGASRSRLSSSSSPARLRTFCPETAVSSVYGRFRDVIRPSKDGRHRPHRVHRAGHAVTTPHSWSRLTVSVGACALSSRQSMTSRSSTRRSAAHKRAISAVRSLGFVTCSRLEPRSTRTKLTSSSMNDVVGYTSDGNTISTAALQGPV